MNFSLSSGLWMVAQLLGAGILVALVARGWHRQYPRFTAYIALQLVAEVFLAFARARFPYTYYFGYWAVTIATIVLTVAICYEVAQHLWPTVNERRRLRTAVILLVVALALGQSGIALWTAAAARSSVPDSITSFILLAERDLGIVVCGVGLFILVFLTRLGISRWEFSVGIIAGFVLYSLVHLLVATALTHPTVLHRSTLAAINSGSYVLAELIWLGYAMLSPKVMPGGSEGSAPPRRSSPGANGFVDNSSLMRCQNGNALRPS